MWQIPKKTAYLQGHHMSTTRMTLQKSTGAEKPRRKRRGTTCGFLHKCQAPACPRNPAATKDRSGKTQCHAKKTEITKQVTSWNVARQSKEEIILNWEKSTVWKTNVKTASAIAWEVTIPDGTDNMQLSSPPRRNINEGKTAKVVTVTLSNL